MFGSLGLNMLTRRENERGRNGGVVVVGRDEKEERVFNLLGVFCTAVEKEVNEERALPLLQEGKWI